VTWQLTAITGKTPAYQGVVPAADQSKYTITFNTDGTFNAKADCNSVGGTYKTSGSNGLTITLGPSTLVACPDGSYGDLFAHALATAVSYNVANDQLTITLEDGGTLTFAPAGSSPSASPVAAASSPAATPTPSPTPSPSPAPTATPTASPSPTATPTASSTAKPTTGPTTAPTATPTTAPTAAPTAAPTPSPSPGTGLTGRTWQLTAITEKVPAFQGVVPAADQSKYTITFNTDGTFQARADCNQVAGTYTSSASGDLSLTIGPSTLVACAEGSLSDLYILGLSNAASYAIANDQLTITLRDQGTLVYK
jgi:heat shock protein HslJ